MRTILTFSVMAFTALSLAACKPSTQTETTERSVDANGTVTETTTQSDLSTDSNGNVEGTVDSKTTVDPEGAMNKETVDETHQEVKH